jgi:DNA-binding NtrC family response regulator
MDDEEMLREMASLMLAHLGHEVALASDGDTALLLYRQALAEGKPFDAVILDLTIPGGVGGKEVVKSLRQLDPNLKAIVSSGYADDPVVSNYQHYGFIDSLSKPYDMSELKKILNRTMQATGTP